MRLDSRALPPWVLPRLSASVPHMVRPKSAAPIQAQITTQLAISLLELGVATQADLDLSRDESVLTSLVMTRWWSKHAGGMPLFNWEGSIRSGKNISEYCYPEAGQYFCISPAVDPLPHFTIKNAIVALEAECPGLGQTAMAVLMDALRYLPHSFSPRGVLALAEWVYWNGQEDERSYAEMMIACGDCEEESVEKFLANNEVFKRETFFQNIPAWLTAPKRVCTRSRAVRSAKSPLATQIIEACDAISAYGKRPEFAKHASRDIFCTDVGVDLIATTFVLYWDDSDSTSRVIDDAFNIFMQGGCAELLTISHIDLHPAGLEKFMRAAEQSLGLARLVGDLVLLIGERQI